MKRKNNTTVALLFLSIAYMVFCCLIFFSLALIIVKLIISHEVDIEQSDIKHVLVASVIAGTAAAFRSWLFAKLDERKPENPPLPIQNPEPRSRPLSRDLLTITRCGSDNHNDRV
ncbi:hypothetical protein UXO08_19620 [Enterobacter kobei]|uniref:hypothetical protein n=1 Tax=Enterobacter kobei TaxID=208224 RepID=UPI00207518C3|nr:hypothetical protein [Enterobacter kobei]MCM7554241.1 hypothetical protein [Enterobacter kobei]